MPRKIPTVFYAWMTAILFCLFIPVATSAESRAFQASLTPGIAVHHRHVLIEGLTLNVWGENPQRALALGVVNGSTATSTGFSLSLLLNYADSYQGVQWACVNFTKGNFLGWQHGFINYIDRHLTGVQTGAVNYSRVFKGVQLGLVNFADTTDTGLQIGIVNIIRANPWFTAFPDAVAPGMVLLNWRF